jgi:hypothetical protein
MTHADESACSRYTGSNVYLNFFSFTGGVVSLFPFKYLKPSSDHNDNIEEFRDGKNLE